MKKRHSIHISRHVSFGGADWKPPVVRFRRSQPTALGDMIETKSCRVDYDSRQGTAGEGLRLVLVFTTVGGGGTEAPAISITSPQAEAFVASARPRLTAIYTDSGSGVDPASVRGC